MLRVDPEFRAWEALGPEQVDRTTRLAIQVVETDIRSFLGWYERTRALAVEDWRYPHELPEPKSLAGDIARLLGDADGHELYLDLCSAVDYDPVICPDSEDVDADAVERFKKAEAEWFVRRMAEWHSVTAPERLLIDVLDEFAVEGWWNPRPELRAAIENLRNVAESNKPAFLATAHAETAISEIKEWVDSIPECAAKRAAQYPDDPLWRLACQGDIAESIAHQVNNEVEYHTAKFAAAPAHCERRRDALVALIGLRNKARQIAERAWQTLEREIAAADARAEDDRVKAAEAAKLVPMPSNQASALLSRGPTDWVEIDATSTPVATCSDNVNVFLQRVGVDLRFNAWLERVEISKANDDWSAYGDSHLDWLMNVAANATHRFRPAEAVFRRAISTIARERTVDPALDLLSQLENAWDGAPRLDDWLAITCDLEPNSYHTAVSYAIVGGMVRRVRHPGVKFDLVAVLSGGQGQGKSTLAKIISLRDEWFTDNVRLGMETKELIALLRGKSVVEIAEMQTRGQIDEVKAMITRTVDSARLPYGREPIERPRRNIMLCTTNDAEMLQDPTGGRRFLPVHIEGEIKLEWLREHVGQIVGEACARETSGEKFELPRELWAEAGKHQSAARAKADFELVLERLYAPERGPLLISAADLVVQLKNALGRPIPPKAYSPTMRALGFFVGTHRIGGIPTRAWLRGDAKAAQCVSHFMSPALPAPDNR
jgi:hypothetical protein